MRPLSISNSARLLAVRGSERRGARAPDVPVGCAVLLCAVSLRAVVDRGVAVLLRAVVERAVFDCAVVA